MDLNFLNPQKEQLLRTLARSVGLSCHGNNKLPPALLFTASVAGAILPSISPPLVHTGTVELRLAQSHIDVIMDTAEPLRQGMAAPRVRLIGF